MPTHLVFQSVAARLDAGTYQPHSRAMVAPSRALPAVKVSTAVRAAECLLAGLLGALVTLAVLS